MPEPEEKASAATGVVPVEENADTALLDHELEGVVGAGDSGDLTIGELLERFRKGW